VDLRVDPRAVVLASTVLCRVEQTLLLVLLLSQHGSTKRNMTKLPTSSPTTFKDRERVALQAMKQAFHVAFI